MAKKAKKKDNKNLIIGICVAVVAVVAIVVAAVIAANGVKKLDDSYFVSDDTKYVLTMESGDYATEEDENTPSKTHVVYTYSGDEITGMTTYAEYTDEATAKSAYDIYKDSDQEGIKNLTLNGKYIIAEMSEDYYANITASEVKSQIEFMEMLKNMDTSDYETVEVESEE